MKPGFFSFHWSGKGCRLKNGIGMQHGKGKPGGCAHKCVFKFTRTVDITTKTRKK